MTLYVLLENKPEGKVTASLIGWPDLAAQGSTEAEAIGSLKQAFAIHLQHAKVVPFEVVPDRPWLQSAGIFKDDIFAAELDAAIQAYRHELDPNDEPSVMQDHAA